MAEGKLRRQDLEMSGGQIERPDIGKGAIFIHLYITHCQGVEFQSNYPRLLSFGNGTRRCRKTDSCETLPTNKEP